MVTAEKIHAPFTKEQVVALNQYQGGPFHAFTCRDRGDHIGEGELVATTRGWICPQCRYEQDWAWGFMVREGARYEANAPEHNAGFEAMAARFFGGTA